MAKFYVYNNASRRLKSGKFTYSFDVIEQFGGSWRGVLRLDDEEEIKVLESFATRLGVNEISEEEYNEQLKKKLNLRSSSISTLPPPTSSLKPAERVVIKDPSAPTTPKVAEKKGPDPLTQEEAVVLGQAPFIDPLEAKNNSRKRKK